MNKVKTGSCPFCGNTKFFISNFADNQWALSHYCPYEREELNIAITVYGETYEEVIEKWNRRVENDK